MPLTTDLPWTQLAIYAVGAALILMLLFKIPYVGRVFRALFSFALLAFGIFLILQQAPFDPNLSRITASLGLDRQEVVGKEVRIPMARDGHLLAFACSLSLSSSLLLNLRKASSVVSVMHASNKLRWRRARCDRWCCRARGGSSPQSTGLRRRPSR